jgi:murein DD-endopeptidase MepM/ murein hydrolase activator NlpD
MGEQRAAGDDRNGSAVRREDPTTREASPRRSPLAARRSGRVLTTLLASLVALTALVVLAGVVGTRKGWIVVERGVVRTASTAGEVRARGFVSPADSIAAAAPAAVPAPPLAPGDTVGLPTVDPALRPDSGRAAGPLDSVSGLGVAPGASSASAPPPVASAADLATLRGRLIVPVRGVATSALHDDFDQARGAGTRRHEALDIVAPRGTPVVAATDGRVVKLFDSEAGGLTIYQSDGGNRFVLLYGHLDRYEPGLREGATVRQGQVIGYVGSTGNASLDTPHLHFAVARSGDPARWWGSGTPVNPYPLLRP